MQDKTIDKLKEKKELGYIKVTFYKDDFELETEGGGYTNGNLLEAMAEIIIRTPGFQKEFIPAFAEALVQIIASKTEEEGKENG